MLKIYKFSLQLMESYNFWYFCFKIVSHERYVRTLTRYDIALVKLKGKIDFKLRHKSLRPICLASPATEVASNCFATGFGETESGKNFDGCYKNRF